MESKITWYCCAPTKFAPAATIAVSKAVLRWSNTSAKVWGVPFWAAYLGSSHLGGGLVHASGGDVQGPAQMHAQTFLAPMPRVHRHDS